MALSFFWTAESATELTAEQLYLRYYDKNDINALEQLVSLIGDDLYYFLLRHSDRVVAEDICQQCWLKLVDGKAHFAGHSRFKTWLFSIARHLLIDELRRLQRWQWQPLEQDALSVACSADEHLSQQKCRLQLGEQLLALPFLQREAIVLQLDGFSLAEICQITAEQPETIKSRLRYARKYLQQHYSNDGKG